MKKIIIAAAIACMTTAVSWAQPTFTFSSASPCTGEEFCVDITVKDFTDITSLKFPIRWDPKVIKLIGVNQFNLPNLSGANFDTTRVGEGLAFLDWLGLPCQAGTQAITRDDGIRIFRMCFRAVGGFGANTFIEITDDQTLFDDPEPIVVRRPPACFNIGLIQKKSFVSLCVRPLSLIGSNTKGNTGDLVCFDVGVSGFDGLASLQFTMDYDSSVLQFSNILVTDKLRNLSRESFGTPDRPSIGKGKITMSWNWTDVQIPSITIPDSTVIFQACFNIIGRCESTSSLRFSSSLTPMEAIKIVQDTQYSIPTILVPGQLQVETCAPTGLQVIADCGPEVNFGNEVCVKVKVRGMQNINQFTYLMNFNANILKFKDVRVLANLAQIPNFNKATHFNTLNAAKGVIGVNWNAPVPSATANVGDGTEIYEICFEVIGLGGNAPLSFDPSTSVVRRTGSNLNIGIAPSNCAVRIKQPESLLVKIANAQGAPGDTVCLGLTAGNSLTGLTALDFSLLWDPGHVRFTSIKNIQIPGANLTNFGTEGAEGGLLSLTWSSPAPVNLTIGAKLFDVCFVVSGQAPGETGEKENCDEVSILEIPLVVEPRAVTVNSQGENIGLKFIPGEVCILNPVGFFLLIGKDSAYRGDTACVDFKVNGFTGITRSEFSITWAPSELRFARVVPRGLPGLQASNFQTTNAGVGIIDFLWTGNPAGTTLQDSTLIFEVCYVPIGPAGKCVPIEVTARPTPSASTVNGQGSVYPISGEACILDRLVITEKIITPVTCPNISDGTVSLKVEGGKGNIFFFWESTPRQFTSKAIRLPVGKVAVTIFDESRPPLVLRDSFEIKLTDTLPTANAGSDKVLGCNPPFTLLSGSGSTGPQFSYSWSTLFGNLPGDLQKPSVIAGAPGDYYLTVFNRNTGCLVRDTVTVRPPNRPEAIVFSEQQFSCTADTVILNAGRSSTGDSISYKWTALDGGDIFPGDEKKLLPRILAPGIYVLEVRNIINGCFSTDTARVEAAVEVPLAKAGNDKELLCDGKPVELDASQSANFRPVLYTWLDSLGKQIAVGTKTQVSKVGTYYLRVKEEGSGCIATDTIKVLATTKYPIVDAGRDTTLTCRNPQLRFTSTVKNSQNFKVQWTALDGGSLAAGGDTLLQPLVASPGRFILKIEDIGSSCVSQDTLVVREDKVPPVVDAGKVDTLSCRKPIGTLVASAPASGITSFWTLNGQNFGTDSLTVRASAAGTYYFKATNIRNGCSSTDSTTVISVIETVSVSSTTTDSRITCASSEVNLQATAAPSGTANYLYAWTAGPGGLIVSGGNTATPRVRGSSKYTVEATSPLSGCKGKLEISVGADTLAPTANAGRDTFLTCARTTVTLSGNGSATGSNIQYAWSAVGTTAAPNPSNAIAGAIAAPGVYILTVRNNSNGCFARDSIKVTIDTLRPQVAIASPAPITCKVAEITLDGTGSDQGAAYTAAWSGVNGQAVLPTGNPYQTKASATGDYRLQVTDSRNGCIGTAITTVPEDKVKPTVKVVRSVLLPCAGAVVSLSGEGSSTGQKYAYRWTTLSGTGTITDETTLAPKINTAGVYGVLISNTENGCSDTAIVTAVVDPNLAKAQAGADQVTCTDDAQITAILPAGSTGVWSSKTGASIEMPNDFVTEVFSLKVGRNVFVWTLSKSQCPNYSSDSLIITREEPPVANDDQILLESGLRRLTLNVVQNDQVKTTAGTLVKIITTPKIGRIDSVAGPLVTYSIAPRLFGMDGFTYQLCNQACPTLCDTASVKVDVKFDPAAAREPVANTITPNGDGTNDELRFEILDNADPEFFPDNEIVIFNRWGDIVFKARPYNNDWRGQNGAGQELPHATYYYILRLDISRGLIIKGDITIIK